MFLLVSILFAALIFKSLGLLLTGGALAMTVFLPLLMRLNNTFLWIWLFLFPVVYYDPLRIATFVFGEHSYLAAPLFLMVTFPGAVASLLQYGQHHVRLLLVTLPLWFMVAGFMLSALHFRSLLSITDTLKAFLGVVVILYLLQVCKMVLDTDALNSRRLLIGLLGIGLFNALAIILEHYTQVGVVNAGGFERPMGLFGFPILASFISVLCLTLSLYQFFMSRTPREKNVYGLCIVALVTACLMSLTKTNILQLVLLFSVWGVFLPGHLKKKFLVLATGLGVGFVCWEIFVDRGALLEQLMSRFSRTDTFSVRQMAWQIVSSNLDLKTILVGKGWLSATELLGTYNYNYAMFPIDLPHKGGASAIHPHNAYLKYTYEMGLAGIGMLLAYIFLMIRGYWLAIRSTDLQKRLACLSIGNIVTAMLFSSITGSPMAEMYALLFFSVALLVLAYQAGWFSPPQPDTSAHEDIGTTGAAV